jgi:putative transposase
VTDRDKDAGILLLRHQIMVLERGSWARSGLGSLQSISHRNLVSQAARNLAMDLEDAGSRAWFLIRDRDAKFPGLFDVILTDAGIETVLSRSRCRE